MLGWNTASMYTSARFSRSRSLVDATGYMVLSGNVMALRNVCIELFSRLTKGSFTGNLRDPQSTECSRIWKTPVSSDAGVLKVMEKLLLLSPLARYRRRAPVRECVKMYAWPAISLKGSSCNNVKPHAWAHGLISGSVIDSPWICARF